MVYQQVITEYPDSTMVQTAKIHKDRLEPLENIYSGNIAAAESATAALKAKYAGSPSGLAGIWYDPPRRFEFPLDDENAPQKSLNEAGMGARSYALCF